jgi:hypothetical protein
MFLFLCGIMCFNRSMLLARNKTKRQHKVYLYEATINMLDGFAGGTVSDNINAIVSAFFLRCGKDMPYLKKRDTFRIKEIRRAITLLK